MNDETNSRNAKSQNANANTLMTRTRTKDWKVMGLYSKDIKKITNKTTKTRNLASKIIIYSHQAVC